MSDSKGLRVGGHYRVHVKRPRGPVVTYDATYLGPDPEKDDYSAFAWLDQDGMLLRIDNGIIESTNELSAHEEDHERKRSHPD